MNRRTGVVVMAYGGPGHIDEVEPYLQDVRGNRPSPAELVADVRRRYQQIGGRSPILERTIAQADALHRALGGPSGEYAVAVGMRHWHPYIGAAVDRLREEGIRRIVGLAMAPHYSRLSIGAYQSALESAAEGLETRMIPNWHLRSGYLGAAAESISSALHRFPATGRAEIPVIFTAHSLPERILTWDDPYPRQLAETMAAVLGRLGERPARFAYQSASHAREPWLGPDVVDVLAEYARAGAGRAVVAPVGFVCEHVEILYDLDIELKTRAGELGIALERAPMLNDSALMIDDLAELVRDTAAGAGWA